MIQVTPLAPGDEVAVGSMFRNQYMKFAGLSLSYDRGVSFQKLLQAQAPRYQTYVAKDMERIRSLISLSSGPRWVDGKIQEVAFVSDFRIDSSRQARTLWRTLLDEVVHKFDSEFSSYRPQHLFATVLKGNKEALRSFVESRRQNAFTMQEVASVNMINIFARLWPLSQDSELVVHRSSESDQKSLVSFLARSEQQRQLGYVFEMDKSSEWSLREKNWNFQLKDFLLLKHKQEIVACVLPWAPQDEIKKMSYSKAPWPFELAFGCLRKIGVKVPGKNRPIKTLYFTHLNISPRIRPTQALAHFLNFIYTHRMNRDYHMVSFADWWGLSSKSEIFRRTFYQKIEVGIYSIAVAGRKPFYTDQKIPFNFEMAVI